MTETTCEWCGAPLPADARFCPSCGNPVWAAPDRADEGPALDVTERKVVTILFADLARSTELATMLDAERFRELMSQFYAMVARELSSLRGRPEKFAGDAVMAVFGLPHAHEDDALRAVRAGVTIRERTARLGERFGLHRPLHVRVGINSGPVAAAALRGEAGPIDRPLISGAAVNLAARLQQAADPGEILAAETTVALTQRAVTYGDPRVVAAKGFGDGLRAWPLLALSARSTRRTIPLVGRRRELRLLTDTYERVRESSRAHLLTVLGEPGIGKSRLVDELLAGLPEDTRVLTGRAGEFDEDVTFAPIAQMLRREMGLERDAPADRLRTRLQEVVEGCCSPSESERVAARLGLALGLGEERPGREEQRYRAAELRAGLVEFLQGMTVSGPAVLVFEDLHLARPGLLDLVTQLVEEARPLPVLVVAVARDSLLEVRPGWGSGAGDAVTIRLEPLSPDEGGELALAAGAGVDEPAARRIAESTGGNPFFIVEVTGMLLQHEHGGQDPEAPHSHLLPPTVQAVVASRIDHLPEDARDLIRKASVLSGSSFDLSELELVAPADERVLRVLEEAELLVPDRERPGAWRFRHETLRDVAYETLPKRERMRLHLQAAEGLQAREGVRRRRQAVAYHLERAARASLDLDPSDRSPADRAIEALADAGDVARWRIESRTAIDLYERALALTEDEERWGEREARILSRLGEARYWLGEFEGAAAALERALRLAPEDVWVTAHASRFLGDIELNIRGRVDRAEELFDRALAASRELADPFAEARVLVMGAWVPYWRSDLDEARRRLERALEIARTNPEGDPWAEARALTSLASVISETGDELECLELAQRALALGREMRDPFTVAVAQQYVGNSLRRMWQLEDAVSHLDDAVRTFTELDARWELASALSDRGSTLRLAGRLEEAERDLREAVRISRALGERALVTWTVPTLVRVLVQQGELAAASELVKEAATLLEEEDVGLRGAIATSELALALGMGDAELAREKALGVLQTRGNAMPNEAAAVVWWVGRSLGADLVGGEDALQEARRVLQEHHWEYSLRDPDLFLEALARRPAADVEPETVSP